MSARETTVYNISESKRDRRCDANAQQNRTGRRYFEFRSRKGGARCCWFNGELLKTALWAASGGAGAGVRAGYGRLGGGPPRAPFRRHTNFEFGTVARPSLAGFGFSLAMIVFRADAHFAMFSA